jgi:hypothetical protein
VRKVRIPEKSIKLPMILEKARPTISPLQTLSVPTFMLHMIFVIKKYACAAIKMIHRGNKKKTVIERVMRQKFKLFERDASTRTDIA